MKSDAVNELAHGLIAQWIAEEAVASRIIDKTPEGYVFFGERNDYYVEIKVFPVKGGIRLKEGS